MKRMIYWQRPGCSSQQAPPSCSQAATTAMTTMEATTDSKRLQLTVNLTAPAGYEASELPSMTVTAVNSDKELTYTETTAAGATSVTFEVSSGQYQITATGRYSRHDLLHRSRDSRRFRRQNRCGGTVRGQQITARIQGGVFDIRQLETERHLYGDRQQLGRGAVSRPM